MYLYRQRSTLASKVLFAIIKANKKSRYYAGFFIYDFEALNKVLEVFSSQFSAKFETEGNVKAPKGAKKKK